MEEYRKAYKSLNQSQKKAVDLIDGPVLVIAGPGTGKTQLLTTRIAHILHETDTLAQNILCLTFTESAAHTMRERLSNMIGQDAYDVTISTYHAFGSEILRRFPSYFTEAAELHPIDELGIDEILREVQTNLPFSNSLKSEFYIRDLKTLLSDSKRALLSPESLRKIVKSNTGDISKLNQLVAKHLDGLKRIDKSSISQFRSLLTASNILTTSKQYGKIIPIVKMWRDSLAQSLDEAQKTSSTKPLTSWKNKWLSKDDAGQFITSATTQYGKLADFCEVFERYEKILHRRKLYDYDDMITRAIEGIAKNQELRFNLQEQYLYILLDEFQDSNESQLELVKLLTDNPLYEDRPNILAVGDDDQAIYSFQGADYSHMLAFTQMYKDVEVIPLAENYRSSEPILRVADGISSQINERLHHYFPGIDKTLKVSVSLSPSIVERDEFKSDVAQYAWIAQKTNELILHGTPTQEIAILAPQHKYLEPLVPYLHHAGIAVRYEKRENVLDDPIIVGLVTMAELVIALHNRDYTVADSLWPEVLSADYWALPTELLWQLSWQAYDQRTQWLSALLNEPQTRPIALFFTRLSTLVSRENMENMLDYLIGITPIKLHELDKQEYKSPFYKFYFTNADKDKASQTFWQLLSNLTVLRQHLREYQSYEKSYLLLEDLLNFISSHRNANINIINTSPYYEAKEAVNLMTAYKAKGQEFQIVFVVGAMDEVWGALSRRRSSTLPLPANLQFIRYAGITHDEQLRLFYVALTRAKTQLYLTSYETTYSNKPFTRLRFLNERENDTGSIVSPLLPPKQQQVQKPDSAAPELVTLTLYWQQRHQEGFELADLKSLLETRMNRFQLSPSNINQFTDILVGGPQNFLLNALLHFPHAVRPNAVYGTTIHQTLEWVHLYNKEKGRLPSEQAVLKQFDAYISDKRMLKSQIKQFSERGKAVLTSYLKQRSHTILPTNETEYNFRREGVFVGDAHLSGNIDKIIVDKDKKEITIVDYKTGQSYQKWSNNVVLHQYKQQLLTYKLLLEQSRSFRNYKVTDAYLEFVEPDSKGNISELHLNFDTNEEQQFKDLVRSIWFHVINLSFPDISAYPQSLGGILMFENELRNIKLP